MNVIRVHVRTQYLLTSASPTSLKKVTRRTTVSRLHTRWMPSKKYSKMKSTPPYSGDILRAESARPTDRPTNRAQEPIKITWTETRSRKVSVAHLFYGAEANAD
jgi:hypothetical protein